MPVMNPDGIVYFHKPYVFIVKSDLTWYNINFYYKVMSLRTSPIGCGVKLVPCQAYPAVEVLIRTGILVTRLKTNMAIYSWFVVQSTFIGFLNFILISCDDMM
jgi:hypothetical protein